MLNRYLILLCLLAPAVGRRVIAQAPDEPQPVVVRAGGIEFQIVDAKLAEQSTASRDDFVDQMSPFDRQSRMKADRDPGVDAYLKFVAGEMLDWPAERRDAVRRGIELLDEPLRKLRLPPIGPVLLAHSSGREESGAAYTRKSTIVLPAQYTGSVEKPNQRLLAHELFHVLSRKHPHLRDQLYAIIGFRYVGQIGLPDELSERTITNPDAPMIEHAIDLKLEDGSKATMVPLLYSDTGFDPSDGRRMFGYMKFRLMEVGPGEKRGLAVKLADGQPILHEPTIADYHRQIGGNTGYIIHPEEILADNFASLVTGAEVKDKWVVDEMRKTLSDYVERSSRK